MNKATNQELDFGIDSFDVEEYTKWCKSHPNKQKSTRSEEKKFMTENQIHNWWIRLHDPKQTRYVHGLPDTYEEFKRTIIDAQDCLKEKIKNPS